MIKGRVTKRWRGRDSRKEEWGVKKKKGGEGGWKKWKNDNENVRGDLE